MKNRLLGVLLALAVGLSQLGGCQKTQEPLEFSTFAMDTWMRFTFYGQRQQAQEAFGGISEALSGLDGLLSVTRQDSDVSRINQGEGAAQEETLRLLSQALALCRLTGGALDITAYPAVRAWGFTSGEYRVPGARELARLAEGIDYSAVRVEGDAVILPDGMEIDLGAVAKGWAGDGLARLVREKGLSSALLDLGQSTIVAVGTKPGGRPWRIAIQDPAGEGYFAVVELQDMAMGTSGGYQRYFEQDGVTYWHILDPATAAPARSGLTSVTVVSDSALLCDGLSTALFVMGLEEGAQFWRDHPELGFEAVFVTEKGEIYRTAGLEENFSLSEEHKGREVVVLE